MLIKKSLQVRYLEKIKISNRVNTFTKLKNLGDTHLLLLLVSEMSSEVKFQMLLQLAKVPELLSEWLLVVIYLPQELLQKNVIFLMKRTYYNLTQTWKVQNSIDLLAV